MSIVARHDLRSPQTIQVREDRNVYTFEVVHADADLEALRAEWADLHAYTATRNPFVHPDWAIPWLRHFVPVDERLVVAARRGGELTAVAPFHWCASGCGPLRARVLQLAGASPGRDDPLTEMTEVLVAARERRRVLRALMHHLVEEVPGWDWLGLTLAADQGWFETEWLPTPWLHRGANVVHKAARPFVVLTLPRSWDALRLKRNQREALRRSRNRLRAHPAEVEICFAEGGELLAALDVLEDLHRRRAAVCNHLHHDDYTLDGTIMPLVRAAATGWTLHGNASVGLVRLDGEPIAGRLLLQSNRGVFFSLSGFEPGHWRLGAAAELTGAAIRRGIESGVEVVNFSGSPDSGKLRWSEEIECQNEFLVVAPRRRSRLLFSAWWQLRSRRSVDRSRRRALKQAVAREP
jgi:CelD/BcsL family acetyltransferase involved in cellulose biosynthesis